MFGMHLEQMELPNSAGEGVNAAVERTGPLC